MDMRGRPEPGHRFVFNDNLFRSWRRVGIDGGESSVVREGEAPGAATYQCADTLWLRAGQITVQGLFTEQTASGLDREVFAITGGTGRYRRVPGAR
jgi:hypothetical protein